MGIYSNAPIHFLPNHVCADAAAWEAIMRYSRQQLESIARVRTARRMRRHYATLWNQGTIFECELMGVYGEAAYAAFADASIDERDLRNGDAGRDFDCGLGSVDVKTTKWGGAYLKVKVGKPCADVLVLAWYDSANRATRLLGWTTRAKLLEQPITRSPYGHDNYELHVSKLYAMHVLPRVN